MKPERLASYLHGASLFSFPIALRSSNSLTNKHRGKRGEQKNRWRDREKEVEMRIFPSLTRMHPVNIKTVICGKSSGFKVTLKFQTERVIPSRYERNYVTSSYTLNKCLEHFSV